MRNPLFLTATGLGRAAVGVVCTGRPCRLVLSTPQFFLLETILAGAHRFFANAAPSPCRLLICRRSGKEKRTMKLRENCPVSDPSC